MAIFYKGQRVKKIADMRPEDRRSMFYMGGEVPVGAEGTVSGPAEIPGRLRVDFDKYPARPYNYWRVMPYQLAPLTDPKAEEFIAWVKKLTPQFEEVKV